MKRLFLLTVILILVGTLIPSLALPVSAQNAGPTVTMAFLQGDPSHLDPAAAGTIDEFTVVRNIYEGLVTVDPKTLAPVPGLAEKWTISPDGLVYTFTLRSGVKFQNGRALTADDVKYSLTRLANPDIGISYTVELLGAVKGLAAMQDKDKTKRATDFEGIKVLDPQTVQITLTKPVASFLNQLTLPGGFVVPKEAAEAPKFDEQPVGTGPYKLKSWVRQQALTLEANPDYWGGAPAVKTAVLKVIPQASQQVIEYQAGNLDIVGAVPEADLPRLTADATLSKQLQTVPTLSFFHLRVNLKDPVMSKPEVREALALSIDRETIVKTILNGNATPAYGMIPPGLSAYDPSYMPFKRDVAKAKDLLKTAGYPDGVDLTVRTGTGDTDNRVLAAIAQQVAEAGIRLKVNSTETTIYNKDRTACNMQMGSIEWDLDYPDPDNVVSLLLGPSGSRKACGYDSYPQSADVGKLLTQANATALGPDRDALLRKAQQTGLDVAALIPEYFGSRTILVNPKLGGIIMDGNTSILFSRITVSQ
ncbi:MAG TPA: ABC transporter substrate-binding protein [Aggregatilineales bacterium]|nr:ABC transporter substrate-binding protein [Aggregatilineales bacterium]